MKLLYLSLAVLGAVAVHKKYVAEEAVGAHKVHGNVALLDESGNTVKASCGSLDRRGKLTHGRTQWINNKKMCVNWNAGTTGNDDVTRECGTYGMICCDADQLLRELDGDLLCTYDVPMCMHQGTQAPGYVSFEPQRCNFGDGTFYTCTGDIVCCDEGSNHIQHNGWQYECTSIPRAAQPDRPEVVDEPTDTELICDADFEDSEGDGCQIYADDDFCDEFYYDDYKNSHGQTARVCPQCGCGSTEVSVGVSTGWGGENVMCNDGRPYRHFELAGKTGNEAVQFEGSTNSYYIGRSYQWFGDCADVGDVTKITFHDNGDLLFKSDEAHTTKLFPNWNEWRCGQSGENQRCDAVRNGEFIWRGVYEVTWTQQSENAVAGKSGTDTSSSAMSSVGTVDGMLVPGLAVVGFLSTLYFIFSKLASKRLEWETIQESEV